MRHSGLPCSICLCAVINIFLSTVPNARAQAHANCNFQTFPLTYQTSSPLDIESLTPFAANDFLTIVGDSHSVNNALPDGGFIHWPNGSVQLASKYQSTVGLHLVDRNNNGTMVGWFPHNNQQNPVIITGAITTPSLVEANVLIGTLFLRYYVATAINDWTSVVGYYKDSANIYHGIKRYSTRYISTPSDSVGLCNEVNCPGIQLDYPGAASGAGSGTFPLGINDSGVVVGREGPQNTFHGFIYSGGNWAKVDFPSSVHTTLNGISNDGTIIGMGSASGQPVCFMYRSGLFKTISPPGANCSALRHISLRTNLILGEAYYPTTATSAGFIAKCQ